MDPNSAPIRNHRSPTSSCVSGIRRMSLRSEVSSMEVEEGPHPPCVVGAASAECSLCLSTLKDPVSFSCGHNFCKHCIDDHWSQPGPAGDYVCPWPQCGRRYAVRPEYAVNDAFNKELNKALNGILHHSPVSCDVCTGELRPPIKRCLTCKASYCEEHFRPHVKSQALRQHIIA